MKSQFLKLILAACLTVVAVASIYYFFDQDSKPETALEEDEKNSRQRSKKSGGPLRLTSSQDRESLKDFSTPRKTMPVGSPKAEYVKNKEKPKGFEDYKSSADRLIAAGNTTEAIQVLQDALFESPDDQRLQTELAFAYIQDDQLEVAKQVFEKKMAEDPNDPEAHLGLGVIDRLSGNVDSALSKFNEALQIDPDNADAKFNMAETLTYERGQSGSAAEKFLAEKYYQDLLQQHPNHPDIQNGLASVYLGTGRTDKAIDVWEKTVLENPNDSILLSNLSEAYIEARRLDDAIVNSQKALENDPNNSDAYFFLGSAEVKKGNQQQGLEAIQKAIELEPENPSYQRKLRELVGQ